MSRVSKIYLIPLLLGLLVSGPGCGDEKNRGPSQPETIEGQVSDFSLPDVNPNSVTKGSEVSPRDYLGRISAWYFGHAT